ncbi:MFS transporter [Aciditerrimonas ferrireducens]|uniref:MFS transporter n=1 Tax=Aciditerrimonas ferrireducens TaxID=667306 RepID=A0ABV6C4F1_9ACTN|nr:MFS transporter [Aciditerrimonas ferrireducens]MCK4177457.1 MFS transporter [Aciditerrimonas ferrireducens]
MAEGPPGNGPNAPGGGPAGTSPGRRPGLLGELGSPRGHRGRRAARRVIEAAEQGLEQVLGGPARTRVVVLLACVLALNSADTATVGAAAAPLRHALRISNTDIGVLVAVTALVGAVASVPFGVLVDRVHRIRLLTVAIVLWGVATFASATVSTFGQLLLVRLGLGAVTAVSGPAVASLVGDWFAPGERGKVYGYVLAGELLGAGVGFVVTGDVAALSWRAAFVVLAIPALLLAWAVGHLPEPARGGASHLQPGQRRLLGRRDLGEAGRRRLGATRRPPFGEEVLVPSAGPTDAQQEAARLGIEPDPRLVLRDDPRRMRLGQTVRYVLSVRTNVVIIISSACAYFFLAGVETFGLEFARGQYGVSQVVADLLMLVVGAAAVAGVLVGGRVGDALVRRHRINGRVLVATVCAFGTVVLFIPAVMTRSAVTALPYVAAAGFLLTAQNPPMDAARLDIMPSLLWGRAEGIRSFLRTGGQALAPVVFGGLSDLLGGGREGLQVTFGIMLLPLAVSGLILLRALRTYPKDVATAAASYRSGNEPTVVLGPVPVPPPGAAGPPGWLGGER